MRINTISPDVLANFPPLCLGLQQSGISFPYLSPAFIPLRANAPRKYAGHYGATIDRPRGTSAMWLDAISVPETVFAALAHQRKIFVHVH